MLQHGPGGGSAVGAVGGGLGGGAGSLAGGGFGGSLAGLGAGTTGSTGFGMLAFGAEFDSESLLISLGGGLAGAAAGYGANAAFGEGGGASGSGGKVSNLTSEDQVAAEQKIAWLNAEKQALWDSRSMSTATVGGLDVTVYGESRFERMEVLGRMERILATERGGEIVAQMRQEGRSSLDITIGNDGPQSFAMQGGRDIYMNFDDVGFDYAHSLGRTPISENRILAHEFGHIGGAADDGVNRMNNINMNENPIMRQLGDHNDRVSYTTW